MMKKNIFSKVCACFVTLILIYTSAGICITPAAQPMNLARNPGFEEGSDTEASSWGLWPGWNVGNFICTDTVHSGNRSVKVELSQQQNYALYAGGYRTTDFELGSAMTLKMWVKYENVTGGFFFGLERKNNDTAVANAFSEAYTGSSDGWIQLIYNVPATEEELSEDIIKVEINKGTGILYIDDITLEPAKGQPVPEPLGDEIALRNPGFEEGSDTEASSWGLWPGWNVGNFICTDTVHSGNRSVKVELSQQQNYALYAGGYRMTDFELGSAMTLKMWVKYENVTGGFFFGLERKSNDTAVANAFSEAYTGSSDGWVELVYEIPAVDLELSEVIVKVEINKGTGTIYFDDFSLSFVDSEGENTGTDPIVPEKPDPDPDPGHGDDESSVDDLDKELVNNPGFENGSDSEVSGWGLSSGWSAANITADVYKGERAVKMTAGDDNLNLFQSSGWFAQTYSFKSAKIFTAWVKYEDIKGGGVYLKVERKSGGQNVADVQSEPVRGTSNGWVQFTLTIPATDLDVDEVIVSVICGYGSGTVYVDEVSFKEYTVTGADTDAGGNFGPDEKKEENLFMNGSFEEGSANDVSGWGISTEWNKNNISYDAYDMGRCVTVALSDNSVYLFQSSAWNSIKYDLNTAKKVTMWVKLENVSGTGVFLIVERKADNKTVSTISSTAVQGSSDWRMMELIIPPISGEIEELVVSVVCGNGNGRVFIDKAVMTEYIGEIDEILDSTASDARDALLRNGGMETLNSDGSIYCWDVWPGDPREGEKFASVSTAEKHGGNQALKISLTENNVQAVYQYFLKEDNRFDFQQAYVFSGYFKFENIKLSADNNIRIGVKRKGADGNYYNAYKEIDTTTKGWHEVKIVVPKAIMQISQYDVIVEIGMGIGDIYMDDFSLAPATEDDLASLSGSDDIGAPTVSAKVLSGIADEASPKKELAFFITAAAVATAAVIAAGTYFIVIYRHSKMA